MTDITPTLGSSEQSPQRVKRAWLLDPVAVVFGVFFLGVAIMIGAGAIDWSWGSRALIFDVFVIGLGVIGLLLIVLRLFGRKR